MDSLALAVHSAPGVTPHFVVMTQGLAKLGAQEFLFTCQDVGKLGALFNDSVTRVEALSYLMPRVVDHMNWGPSGPTPFTRLGLCGAPS